MRLAQANADIVINYVSSRAAAEEVADEVRQLDCRVAVVKADVSERDDVEAMIEFIGDEFGKIRFNEFAHELRDDLNNSVSDAEIIEMLAQHLITKPVFDALFKDHSFAEHNPMSLAMQKVLDALNEHHLEKEADTLNSFYESVRMRAEGINTAEGKQSIILTLYDSFFKNAFPEMTKLQLARFSLNSLL